VGFSKETVKPITGFDAKRHKVGGFSNFRTHGAVPFNISRIQWLDGFLGITASLF